MRSPHLFAAVAVFLCVPGQVRMLSAKDVLPEPQPRYSADTILSGEMPGRKESPQVPFSYDTNGFAADRLYHVPALGIHPRILFAPEDLPRLRDQFRNTAAGRQILASLRTQIADGIDKPGTGENQLFQALVGSDPSVADKSLLQHDQEAVARLHPEKSHVAPGSNYGKKGDFDTDLELRCFLALLDDDKQRGVENGRALGAYARHLQPRIDTINASDLKGRWWNGTREVFGKQLAFAYDFSQPFMTPQDQASVRHLIASASSGHYTLGMDLPHHWRNWNFIGMALHFPLLALAIEGEEGSDPRIYKRGVELLRDYLTYSVSPDGVGKEGVGYHTAGMAHASILMLAAANRGDNLFTYSHYRNMANWLLWCMQPFGGAWNGSGDLAVFPPSISFVMPMKFFYPVNPRVDYLYQNLPIVRSGDFSKAFSSFPSELCLTCPADPERTPDGKLVDYHGGRDLGFPNSFFDGLRGILFARTAWDPMATDLHFEGRQDTTFASHDHASRGDFTFSSMGRAWAVNGFRETETKQHSCITIDDRGQGYFPPPAKWLGVIQNSQADFGVVDLKYCWDWFWVKSVFVEAPERLKKEHLEDYLVPQERLLKRFPLKNFEEDPSPSVVAYYKGYQAGDPRMWGEDEWVARAPHYPVQKAFRTTGLVRGTHPYALIMDDIRKDDAEHLYDWRMVVPTEVDLVGMKGNDIILGDVWSSREEKAPGYSPYRDRGLPKPEKGTPQLLVRTLEANQPDIPTQTPAARLETGEWVKTDDTHQFAGRSFGIAKRLVIPSRSVTPDFKILLIPFHEGEAIPETVWNADHTEATLTWPDQKDTIRFTKTKKGLTEVEIKRDGKELVNTANLTKQ